MIDITTPQETDALEPSGEAWVGHYPFYDLLIRDDPQLDHLLSTDHDPVGVIQKLLWVSVSGIGLYGLAVNVSIAVIGSLPRAENKIP